MECSEIDRIKTSFGLLVNFDLCFGLHDNVVAKRRLCILYPVQAATIDMLLLETACCQFSV